MPYGPTFIWKTVKAVSAQRNSPHFAIHWAHWLCMWAIHITVFFRVAGLVVGFPWWKLAELKWGRGAEMRSDDCTRFVWKIEQSHYVLRTFSFVKCHMIPISSQCFNYQQPPFCSIRPFRPILGHFCQMVSEKLPAVVVLEDWSSGLGPCWGWTPTWLQYTGLCR